MTAVREVGHAIAGRSFSPVLHQDGIRGGGRGLIDLSGCYRKPPSSSMKVGGLEVGISGLSEIFEKGLEHMDESDEEIKIVLLTELKARNYVPSSVEKEYMAALWSEYKRARVQRREDVEQSYKGIPRDEIPWFPKVDSKKCSGCSSCVEFCSQGVFTFDGKSHVAKPYNCVVGKSSCRAFCPERAITFPTQAELKVTLQELNEKYGISRP
ncbi:MAG: ferredoxin family protein [Methanomassiliicoccales archaeon]|nr:ferredoxin family protein [Methanomassiliicoccales archaeon]